MPSDGVKMSKTVVFPSETYSNFSLHVLSHLTALTLKIASFQPTPCEKGEMNPLTTFVLYYKMSHVNDTNLIQQMEQVCATSLIVVTLFTFM